MITKPPFTDNLEFYGIDYAFAYPASTITVGRARLLYQILHDFGMDELKEVMGG